MTKNKNRASSKSGAAVDLRVVMALPERTLKRESKRAWAENLRWKQEKRHELAAWYEGYGAAIDWALQIGKRHNDRTELPRRP